MLKKAHKYSELIILYEKKGLHRKGKGLGAVRTSSVAGAELLCCVKRVGIAMTTTETRLPQMYTFLL